MHVVRGSDVESDLGDERERRCVSAVKGCLCGGHVWEQTDL